MNMYNNNNIAYNVLRVYCIVVEHVVFSIRIPKSLADEIDGSIDVTGHSNRNDFIRSACRFYLIELAHKREAKDKDQGANTSAGEAVKSSSGVGRS